MKPMNVSSELAAIVGEGPMSRPEITKQIWVYIKKHNLQDSQNKRTINADANLQKVSGGVASFDMMKLGGFISKHVS